MLDRPEAGQQPAQVRRLPPAGSGIAAAPAASMSAWRWAAIGVVGHLPAGLGQPLPIRLRVGRQRPAERLGVEVPARGQLEHALAPAPPPDRAKPATMPRVSASSRTGPAIQYSASWPRRRSAGAAGEAPPRRAARTMARRART